MKQIIHCECETSDIGFVVKHKCDIIDKIYCDKEKRIITKERIKNENLETKTV